MPINMCAGTTWMAGIVPLVLMDGDMDKVNAMGHMEERVPYVDISFPGAPSFLETLDKRTSPNITKTHLRYEFARRQVEDGKLKVILVVRNPKDTLVSFYHMYKSQEVLGKFKGSFHDFFELFKAKKMMCGDIFEWNKAWWEQRHRDNILAVKYEEMQQDCADVVRKVAKFLGKGLDNSTVDKIVQACSIKNMRKDPMVNIQNSAVDMAAGNFYRKGEVGDWVNYFNEEESKLIDQKCKEHFDPIGLYFNFK